MDKRKKQLLIIAILLPVFSIVIVSGAKKMRARSRRPITVEAKTVSGSAEQNQPLEDNQQLLLQILDQQNSRELRYLQDGFARDPFIPREELYTVEEIQLTLNGLLSRPNRGAIINGEIVAAGSSVRGFLIEEIQLDEVILQRNGKQFKLRVGKPLKLRVRKRKSDFPTTGQ